MIFGLYSVKDSKVGYGAVIMQPDDDQAIRLFEHECMQQSSLWNSHAEDFYLVKIGYFDTDNGFVGRNDDGLEIMVTTSEVVKRNEEKYGL